MRRRGLFRKRGAVLIVVLGVLVVLALLATTFASLQQIERTIAKNYIDDIRAKLLAQSGVEYAISQIRDMMSQGLFSASAASQAWIYWGNDTGETGSNPALMNVPIEQAQNPSFAHESETPQNPADANVTPQAVTILDASGNTVPIGFSSAHDSGTYAPYGDIYTLRVVDASGMIYVNDGVYQYGGNNSTVSQNLRRILNNLGQHPSVNVANLGDSIMNNRPANGYSSKYELRKAVNYNDTLFNQFKDFVTTHAWVDKNVVLPVPLSAQMLNQYPITYYRGNVSPIYRRGRGMNNQWQDRFAVEPLRWYTPSLATNPNHNAIYAHDELFPSYIEVVWRAPVNVNAAAEPVLSSLIADVRGFFSIERRRYNPLANSPANMPYSGGGFFGSPISFTIPRNYYTWMYKQNSYDSQGQGSDEVGNLYDTAPFLMPGGGSTTGGVSAQLIAQEIIACRAAQPSPGMGSVNYANEPFGGPFRNWAQFYAFLDKLVAGGVIQDPRNIYGEFLTNPMPTGNYVWTATNGQGYGAKKYAGQAMADALKANFNPNLHLNETNLDRNMHLIVDKTDLIVNSTEFCFAPLGYYEIESLGRVLRPQELVNSGGTAVSTTALTSTGNHVVAEKKIIATIKMFDVYRETSQRHFYQGTLFPRQSSPETNNNKGLELGPEPDNGPLVYNDMWGLSGPFQYTPAIDGYAGYPIGVPSQNTGWGYEFGGYIALPTIGGNLTNPAASKPPGSLWTTSAGGAQFGSTMHAHYSWDFKLHHSASAIAHGNDWFRDELGSVYRYANNYIDTNTYQRPAKRERAVNFNDRLEATLSPYGPTVSTKHRLARSFRMPMQPSGSSTVPTGPPPPLQNFAPSDLRIDGAYSERHSGLAYWIDESVTWNTFDGMMSFWIKPNFYPEHTGKMRKIVGLATWHAKNFTHNNPHGWDMFYAPAHDRLPIPSAGIGVENNSPAYVGAPYSTCADHPPEATGGNGVNNFRPASLFAQTNYVCYDGALADMFAEGPWIDMENWVLTPSLNHRYHQGHQAWNDYLSKGRWTHLTYWWHVQVGSYVPTANHQLRIYVNGQILSGTVNPAAGTMFNSSNRKPWHTIQSYGETGSGAITNNPGSAVAWRTNTVRLGENSNHGFGTFNRNHASDATYDEYYMWALNGTSQLNNSFQIWQRGRYYKPLQGNYADAAFVSGPINLDQVAPVRNLPPPSSANPPVATGSGSPGSTAGTTTAGGGGGGRRLLGISWTWMAEDYRPSASTGGGGVLRPGGWNAQPGGTAQQGMVPVMYDYQNPSSPIPLYQTDTGSANGTPEPCVHLFMIADGQQLPLSQPNGFLDDGFSKIVDSSGKPYTVQNPQDVRYKVWIQVKGAGLSTVLLATPYLDDVTLYYDSGDVEFLMYALVNI